VGKTSVAHLLAAHLGHACICVDDLRIAASAVTEKQTHPGLHVMTGVDYRQYYVESSLEQLIHDAELQHRSMWPAIRGVIEAHLSWARPAIIEGWGFFPKDVRELTERQARAFWLVADREVLENRLRAQDTFWSSASNPDLMFAQYLARSLWIDQYIRQEAKSHGSRLVDVCADLSAIDIANRCLELVLECGTG